MNTFYLKTLILMLSFSLHVIAATLEQQVAQTRKNIEFHHNARRDMFNADVQNLGIAECSRSIDTILGNERNVREVKMSKHDLLKHQETILSSVMAKVFIAYTETPQKIHVSTYDKRGMGLDSARHRHFEILRLTEDLSDSFSEQVTKDLTFNRDILRRLIVGEYEQIFTYSGLNHDVFLDWFGTIFHTHFSGFVAKNPQDRGGFREHRAYSPIYGGFDCEGEDLGLQEAIALSMQGQGAAVAVASAVREECTEDAALSAFLSQEEIAEQVKLLWQHEQEKATQDFLRAEREAQANLLAVPFDAALYYPEHEAREGYVVAAVPDDLTAALSASFEETADKAREKITIFPVSSRDVRAMAFKVNVGELLEKVVENEDSIELFGIHWKMTNRGDFLGKFRGNSDRESMIEPTVVMKVGKNHLVSYTFKKENGELVELKLEGSKPKTTP